MLSVYVKTLATVFQSMFLRWQRTFGDFAVRSEAGRYAGRMAELLAPVVLHVRLWEASSPLGFVKSSASLTGVEGDDYSMKV